MPRSAGDLRTIAYASIWASLASVALLCHIWLEPAQRGWKLELAEYSFVVFATIALIIVYNGFNERLHIREGLNIRGFIFVFAALLFVAVYQLGMYQLGGFDEVYIINSAVHYREGYRPITDYPSPMPPLFLAGIRAVELLFRFQWKSFSLFTALFAAVTTIWLFGLLRTLRYPRHWALILAATVELSTTFILPFWWYNNTTTLVVVLLLLSVVACLKRGDDLLPWVSLAVSLGMTMAAKPNILLVCVSPLLLLWTRRRSYWYRTATAIGAAAGIFLLICLLAEVTPAGLFRSYLEVSKLRGNPLLMYPFGKFNTIESLAQICLALFVLVSFIDILARAIRSRRHPAPLVLACSLSAITCIEMTCTNVELKSVDLVVLIVASALLTMMPSSDGTILSEANLDWDDFALCGLVGLFWNHPPSDSNYL